MVRAGTEAQPLHGFTPDEIADVFIYLTRLADKLGVDIEKAILDKIAQNEKKYPVKLAKDNATKYNKR